MSRNTSFSLVFACLLSLATRTARADVAQDARASFERGVAASRESRWEDAEREFRRSLELIPKPSTMFNLAVADIKLGHGREALEQLTAFERAASPQEHAAMLERARVLRAQAQALVDSEQSKAEHGGNALSQADDGLSDEARREVSAARAHYAAGRDREALSSFERAYKLSKRPELLYNIGVVADRMRADARAVRAYEAFIAALPDAPEAAVAEVRSEALREGLLRREHEDETLEPRAAARAPAPVIEREPASAEKPDLVGPRAVLATGVVLIAGAGGALGWYFNRQNDYDSCEKALTADPPCTNLDDIKVQRNAAIAVTIASGVVGIGLTTAGAVWLAQRRSALHALVPWGSQRAAGLSLRGAF